MEQAWLDVLWVAGALLVAGFVGWPVTVLVFRLARTIDEKTDEPLPGAQKRVGSEADPAADVTVDADPGTGNPSGEHAAAVEPPPAVAVTETILRGGAIIGVLERLAVAVAILAGQPVAIAYIVAIKGLGRFAELKETPAAAERFIIGTLTSMLWAAGVAAVVKTVFLG
ncbi:hypothetical protein V1639_02330 [Pseudarthrobacter sp. J75]|uniref:hypothetical protein n=1 Tax=unclassified Pseudarthrobacter TaxID=2647000 RepID=UPI002E823761|nr:MULTISPECIES: hypothetical protein [unclassified Pseudarthrobacter]MEE2521788.1 hypothetical protein [Pseudarthrobacter sp. J47]MEE2527865.1 hypothetical protein [Pseudarthrobacter sp. J75]